MAEEVNVKSTGIGKRRSENRLYHLWMVRTSGRSALVVVK
jgi:hypothetical protein